MSRNLGSSFRVERLQSQHNFVMRENIASQQQNSELSTIGSTFAGTHVLFSTFAFGPSGCHLRMRALSSFKVKFSSKKRHSVSSQHTSDMLIGTLSPTMFPMVPNFALILDSASCTFGLNSKTLLSMSFFFCMRSSAFSLFFLFDVISF